MNNDDYEFLKFPSKESAIESFRNFLWREILKLYFKKSVLDPIWVSRFIRTSDSEVKDTLEKISKFWVERMGDEEILYYIFGGVIQEKDYFSKQEFRDSVEELPYAKDLRSYLDAFREYKLQYISKEDLSEVFEKIKPLLLAESRDYLEDYFVQSWTEYFKKAEYSLTPHFILPEVIITLPEELLEDLTDLIDWESLIKDLLLSYYRRTRGNIDWDAIFDDLGYTFGYNDKGEFVMRRTKTWEQLRRID